METKTEGRAEKVQRVFIDCLFTADEIVNGQPPADAVIVDGVVRKYGLHPKRLASHRDEIRQALVGLAPEFYKSSGGGMTFLNLCVDAAGEQWGEHINCEQLCVLAIASGMGKWCMPRDMWSVLPGGMPYVAFNVENAAPVDRIGEANG